jgi:integration host factor subunit beta
LTKNDIALQLTHEKRLGLSKTEALDIVETVFDLIALALSQGDRNFSMRGFGSLRVRQLRAFTGRHPRTGEAINVPTRKSVSFKPSNELLHRLN